MCVSTEDCSLFSNYLYQSDLKGLLSLVAYMCVYIYSGPSSILQLLVLDGLSIGCILNRHICTLRSSELQDQLSIF